MADYGIRKYRLNGALLKRSLLEGFSLSEDGGVLRTEGSGVHSVFLPGLDQRTVDKSTERWIGEIEERLNYTVWYCGHYHTVKKIDRIEFMFDNFGEFPENNDDDWDNYNWCYECGGYGDDFHIDENGELASSCPGCPTNPNEDDNWHGVE